MLYEISEMYKRDTSFTLCESENAIQFSDVQNCKMISFINRPLKYQTDRIDEYIFQYDVLPTIGGLLVSAKFKLTFSKSKINVIQPFYYNDNMANHLIVRMKECNSFIIVSELFKELAEEKKLKGITFNPEGKSVYTKLGLEEAREKMNKWLSNIVD